VPLILIRPAAEDDLINIWITIFKDNQVVADKVLSSAKLTFTTIAEMPKIGAKFQSKRRKLQVIRFFPIKNYASYIIYYREIKDGIEIVRVLHSKMQKANYL